MTGSANPKTLWKLTVVGTFDMHKQNALYHGLKLNPPLNAHAVKLACWAKLTLLLKFMAVGSHSIHTKVI